MENGLTLYILPHSKAHGDINLKKDSKIFKYSIKKNISILRTYEWKTPCFTYGYFQIPPLNTRYQSYKRITGGGIVFHDIDITFSLTGPFNEIFKNSEYVFSNLSTAVFLSLRNILESNSLKIFSQKSFKNKNYNCFEKYADKDIICNNKKIFGGAIRKKNNHFLFQGTVKLEREKTLFRELLIKNISHYFEHIEFVDEDLIK